MRAPHFRSYGTKFLLNPTGEALDSHLKSLAKTGVLSSTKHKQALEREDVEQLFTAKQLGNDDTPESLVQTAWFYLMLYFGKRGRENQINKGRHCFRKNRKRQKIILSASVTTKISRQP